jgi:hypothetical protein
VAADSILGEIVDVKILGRSNGRKGAGGQCQRGQTPNAWVTVRFHVLPLVFKFILIAAGTNRMLIA